jgi:hypothetical protein
MLTTEQVKALINEDGYIQDIGQISKGDRRALDKAVRAGQLAKTRIPWLGWLGPMKTTWVRVN